MKFKVVLKDGTEVTIEAQSEKHARAAIARGRKVGRYTGRVVSVQPLAAVMVSPETRALAEDTFARIEGSIAVRDTHARKFGE